MTRLRLASAAAIMAFLAVPVAYTAWSQDKADPKAGGGDKSELYQQLNLFGDVLERVRRDYVEPVEEKTLIENAINGMLTALDPHSSYMNPKTYKDMQVQTKGEFGGLGIEVTRRAVHQGCVADRRHAPPPRPPPSAPALPWTASRCRV